MTEDVVLQVGRDALYLMVSLGGTAASFGAFLLAC